MMRRRPVRRRTLRRRLLPLLGAVIVAASMATAVRRGAEARRLSREIEALSRAERVTRGRMAAVMGRLDSLSSRARIREAAAELGLRPSTDREIVFLKDVDQPSSIE
jgi:hypothetical protein